MPVSPQLAVHRPIRRLALRVCAVLLLSHAYAAAMPADGGSSLHAQTASPPLPRHAHYTIESHAPAQELVEPQGVAVGPEGRVFVVDRGAHRVQVWTPEGEWADVWGVPGMAQGQLLRPVGVAVGPEGDVYVTDSGNDRVQVFSSTGRWRFAWGGRGRDEGRFREPWGIAVSAQGTVFVADRGNDRIQRFDAAGRFQGTWRVTEPEWLATDENDDVWLTDRTGYRVRHFDAKGNLQAELGEDNRNGDREWRDAAVFSGCVWDGGPFTGPRIMYCGGPTGIAVGIDRLVVADTGPARDLLQLDREGGFQRRIGQSGPLPYGPIAYRDAGGVALDAHGATFVTDPVLRRVIRFHADGMWDEDWPRRTPDPATALPSGAWRQPSGITVLPDGTTCVADRELADLRCYDQHGLPHGWFGRHGSLTSSMVVSRSYYAPTVIDAAGPARIVAADAGRNGPLIDFDLAGRRISARLGPDGTPLSAPGAGGVAALPDGRIAVSLPPSRSGQPARVHIFDGAGRLMQAHAGAGEGVPSEGGFLAPRGLDLAADGTVFLANGDVADPSVLRLPPSAPPTTWRGTWVEPTDVAHDAAHDRLIVADAGRGVLQALGLDGRPLGAWGGDPADVLRLGRPEHLSLGPDGSLAVLDTQSARATIYRPQPETRWRFEVFDGTCLCGSVREVVLLEEASWPAEASRTTPHTLRVTKVLAPEDGALRLRLHAGGPTWLWLDDRLLLQQGLDAGTPQTLLLPPSTVEQRLELVVAGIAPGGTVRIEAEWLPAEMLRRVFLPWGVR